MPLAARTGDDGIELLADSRLQQQRRRRFSDLPFHLLGCILLFRAVLCQRLQIVRCRRAPVCPARAAFSNVA